jgi:hypothetical protein
MRSTCCSHGNAEMQMQKAKLILLGRGRTQGATK